MGQKKQINKGKCKPSRQHFHGQGLLIVVLLWFISLFAYGIYETDNRVASQVDFVVAQFIGEARGTWLGSGEDKTAQLEAIQTMEVHFLDVGQGDATLIKCGGQSMLIDAGEEDQGTAIQYYLIQQGIEKLDYLVLTHPDSDHIGSADVIINKFEIGQVMMSRYEKDNISYRNLLQAMDYKYLEPVIPQKGDIITLGSAVCTIMAPLEEYENANNASLVLLVQNGENRFLFTGDAEVEAEEDLLAAISNAGESLWDSITDKADGLSLRADVYKAGHHGSNTSSGEAFLDAIDPDYVVISCGMDNEYGHPHQEVLERLSDRGVQVYRTDESGTIVMISDGVNIFTTK